MKIHVHIKILTRQEEENSVAILLFKNKKKLEGKIINCYEIIMNFFNVVLKNYNFIQKLASNTFKKIKQVT